MRRLTLARTKGDNIGKLATALNTPNAEGITSPEGTFGRDNDVYIICKGEVEHRLTPHKVFAQASQKDGG